MRRMVAALAAVCVIAGCSGDDETESAEAETGAATVAAGRILYRDHGCALCHGDEGRGNGRMAPSLDPRPRDFSQADQFRLGHTPAEIAESIRTGAGGRGAMPGYGHLSEQERTSLAMFIASLAPD